MTNQRSTTHVIDIMFVLALFGVFIITALLVTMLGASVYESTVDNMNKNFDTQTSISYVTTKIRQNDMKGAIHTEEIDGITALVLERSVGDNIYQTWIFHTDGELREIFIKKGGEVSAEFGVFIMNVDTFEVKMLSESLVSLISSERDGNMVETLVGTRT